MFFSYSITESLILECLHWNRQFRYRRYKKIFGTINKQDGSKEALGEGDGGKRFKNEQAERDVYLAYKSNYFLLFLFRYHGQVGYFTKFWLFACFHA